LFTPRTGLSCDLAMAWPWAPSREPSNPLASLVRACRRPEAVLFAAVAASIVWAFLAKRISPPAALDAEQRKRVAKARLKHLESRSPVRVAARQQRSSEAEASLQSEGNYLVQPRRYRPPPMKANDREPLRARSECVEVRDNGRHAWVHARRSLLDTGNEHMTVLDRRFAEALGVASGRGRGGGVFSQPERYTTLRGVNPGAETRAPVHTVSLRLRGREFTVPVAVCELAHLDVLVGLDVLQPLFSEGLRLVAG
jgi:predicted aspartyl protease